MKTSKIITNLITLNLVFFMTVTSIANPYNRYTGDIIDTNVKNQIATSKCNIEAVTSAPLSENEFWHLRFDVKRFTDGISSELKELPLMNEFEYLRFDVNNYKSTSNIFEIPEDEFNYLRFDVNTFSVNSCIEIGELPENVDC